MKSIVRKIIEKFDSSANTFSMRLNELQMDLHKFNLYGELSVKSKMRDFLMHEKLIRNDELFWTMFGSFYIGTPQSYHFHKEINDAIKRGTRLEIPLPKRIRLSNAIKSGRDLEKEINDLSNFISKHTADEDIIIFRGFLVPEGKEIREGRFIDDPSSHIQDEGLGFSFTFDKNIAIAHSIINTSSAMLLKLYGEDLIGDKSQRTWKEFSTTFQKLDTSREMLERTLKYVEYIKMLQGGDIIQSGKKYESASEYIGFNVRPCVAKYSIKKNDIKTALNFDGTEMEIFCNPSNVFLLHYEFTSWTEQKKQWKTNSDASLFKMNQNISHLNLRDSKGASLDEVLELVREGIKVDEEYFNQLDPD